MDKLPQRTFLVIIVFYILAFILFFLFSVYSFSGVNVTGKILKNTGPHELNIAISIDRDKPESKSQILMNFKLSWILSNSMKLFIQYLLTIQCTALIVAFSLIFPWRMGIQRMQTPFVNVIGRSIFLFLILTLFYTGLSQGLLPGLLKKQSEKAFLTEIALDYLEKANNEITSKRPDKDFKETGKLLGAYLQIDPGNLVVRDTLNWVNSVLDKDTVPDKLKEDLEKPGTSRGQKAADLIQKAAGYYEKEDYFSSLYYANMAFNIDDSRKEAKRIAAESRDAIRSLEPDKSEKKAREYFITKRKGFDALETGDPISAYYIFKKLSETSSNDKDIPEFLKQSINAISQNAFFIDEIEKYAALPGIDNITFLNNKTTLINIGKMIPLIGNEAYFFNIEVINFDRSNEINKHFTAVYGKYSSASNSIILQAIDRENSNIKFSPVYLTGNGSYPENIILKINPTLSELQFFGQSSSAPKNMNILNLFNYASIANKYGYIEEPLYIVILDRVLNPFTFLIVSFFSVSLGWLLRIRKYTFPWFGLILTPLIAFVIYNILTLYEYSMNLFLGFVLFKTGFYPSVIILLVSQALFLFISLVSIARQRT